MHSPTKKESHSGRHSRSIPTMTSEIDPKHSKHSKKRTSFFSGIGVCIFVFAMFIVVFVKWAMRHPESPIVQYYHHFNPSDFYDTSIFFQSSFLSSSSRVDFHQNKTAQMLFLLKQYETEILYTLSNNVVKQGDEYFRMIPDSKTAGKQFAMMDADLCRIYTLLNLFELSQIDRVDVLSLFPYKPIAGGHEVRILPVTPPPMHFGVSSKRDILIVYTTCCNQLPMTMMSLQYLRNTNNIADILVVDDHSTDGTVPYIQKRGFAIISKDRAKGLTDSWNIGYRMAIAMGYKHVLFTNNDVLLTAGAVHLMHHSLKAHPLVVPLTTEDGAGHHKLQSIFEALNVSTKFAAFANDYRNAEFIQETLLRKYIYVPKDQRRCPSQTSISYDTNLPKFNGFCFGVNLELIAPAAFEANVHLFDPKDRIVGQEDALATQMARHNLMPIVLHCTFVYHFKSRTVSSANFTFFQEQLHQASDGFMFVSETSSFPTVKITYRDPLSGDTAMFFVDIREDLRWYHAGHSGTHQQSSNNNINNNNNNNNNNREKHAFVHSLLAKAKFVDDASSVGDGLTTRTTSATTSATTSTSTETQQRASGVSASDLSAIVQEAKRRSVTEQQLQLQQQQQLQLRSLSSDAASVVGSTNKDETAFTDEVLGVFGALDQEAQRDTAFSETQRRDTKTETQQDTPAMTQEPLSEIDAIWEDLPCRPIDTHTALFPKRQSSVFEKRFSSADMESFYETPITTNHKRTNIIHNNERNRFLHDPFYQSDLDKQLVKRSDMTWNMRVSHTCVYPSHWGDHCTQLLLEYEQSSVDANNPSSTSSSSSSGEHEHVHNRERNEQETVSQLTQKMYTNVFDPELYAKQPSGALVIAIAMSDPVATPSAGDIFTARELAAALESQFSPDQVQVKLLPRGPQWYNPFHLRDVDVLIALLDDYDLSKVLSLYMDATVPNYFTQHSYVCPATSTSSHLLAQSSNNNNNNNKVKNIYQIKPNLITVAWMRNWFHRWLTKPWIGNYDLLLTSSELSQSFFQEIAVKIGLKTSCMNSCPHKKFGEAPPVVPVKYRVRVQAATRQMAGVASPLNNNKNNKNKGRRRLLQHPLLTEDHVHLPLHSVNNNETAASSFESSANSETAAHSRGRRLRAAAGAIVADFHWTFFSPRLFSPHHIYNFPLATSCVADLRHHPIHQLQQLQLQQQQAQLQQQGDFATYMRSFLSKLNVPVSRDTPSTTLNNNNNNNNNNNVLVNSFNSFFNFNVNHSVQGPETQQTQHDTSVLQAFLTHVVQSNATLTAARLFFNVDFVFTGSYFNVYRRIMDFDPARLSGHITGRVVGHNWQRANVSRAFHQMAIGFVPYEVVLESYRFVKIVVDDANHVTGPFASCNSRVFDALGAGALVLSNNAVCMQEMFSETVFRPFQVNRNTRHIPLPVYDTAETLVSRIEYFVAHDTERVLLMQAMRDTVLARHSYAQRARDLAQILKRSFGVSLTPVTPASVSSSSVDDTNNNNNNNNMNSGDTAKTRRRQLRVAMKTQQVTDTHSPQPAGMAATHETPLSETLLVNWWEKAFQNPVNSTTSTTASITTLAKKWAQEIVADDLETDNNNNNEEEEEEEETDGSRRRLLRDKNKKSLYDNDNYETYVETDDNDDHDAAVNRDQHNSSNSGKKKDDNNKNKTNNDKKEKKKTPANVATKDKLKTSDKPIATKDKKHPPSSPKPQDTTHQKQTSKTTTKKKSSKKDMANTSVATQQQQQQPPPGKGLCIGVRTTERDELWLPILVRSLIVQHSKSKRFRNKIPMQIFLVDTEAKTDYVQFLLELADVHNERFNYPYVQVAVSKKTVPGGRRNHLYGYDDTDVLLEEMLRVRHCDTPQDTVVESLSSGAEEDTAAGVSPLFKAKKTKQKLLLSEKYTHNNDNNNFNGNFNDNNNKHRQMKQRFKKYALTHTPPSSCEWIMFTNGDNMYNAAWFEKLAPLMLSRRYDILGWDFITHHLRANTHREGVSLPPLSPTDTQQQQQQQKVTHGYVSANDLLESDISSAVSRTVSAAALSPSISNQVIEVSLNRGFVDLGSVMIRAKLYAKHHIRFLEDAVFTEDLFLRDFRTVQNAFRAIETPVFDATYDKDKDKQKEDKKKQQKKASKTFNNETETLAFEAAKWKARDEERSKRVKLVHECLLLHQ